MPPIVILTPETKQETISKHYLEPYGITNEDVLLIQTRTALNANSVKEHIQELLVEWNQEKILYVICLVPIYFKQLTKHTTADKYIGYIENSPYGSFKVLYLPQPKAIFLDPNSSSRKIDTGMSALIAHHEGVYVTPGTDIIHKGVFPQTYEEIQQYLSQFIIDKRPLTIDIETTDLKHYKADIVSICFCWNQHEGISFLVTEAILPLLKQFFIQFEGKTIYHNISFDVYILIFKLFMKDVLDTEGLLTGIQHMLKNWDDTKLITYLATNSCAGNKLSLKEQAQEFAGNYAHADITDVLKIPTQELLTYNLIDGLSTWFVYNKHMPTLLKESQEDIYESLFKPAIADIIQMQLTGLPLNQERVLEVKSILESNRLTALNQMNNNPIVIEFIQLENEQWVIHKNSITKKKKVTLQDANEKFNPNSGPQLQRLFYDFLKLPILATTDSGKPATDRDTLLKLQRQETTPEILSLLGSIIDYSNVNILLNTFITAFEEAPQAPDNWWYLYGNFNLGGTVSGRMSSSKPNLQNIPSTGNKYAKLIKSCFQAPPGYLFVGLDFDSLEDKISALTTGDSNKQKVYLDGYDGHCLRAYSYFKDQMPTIELAEPMEQCYSLALEDGSTVLVKETDILSFGSYELSVKEYIAQKASKIA